jgi:hypothetical protein
MELVQPLISLLLRNAQILAIDKSLIQGVLVYSERWSSMLQDYSKQSRVVEYLVQKMTI